MEIKTKEGTESELETIKDLAWICLNLRFLWLSDSKSQQKIFGTFKLATLELLFSLRAHINSSSVRQTEQGPFSFTHHKRDLWWGNYPAQVTQTVNKVRTKMQILDF